MKFLESSALMELRKERNGLELGLLDGYPKTLIWQIFCIKEGIDNKLILPTHPPIHLETMGSWKGRDNFNNLNFPQRPHHKRYFLLLTTLCMLCYRTLQFWEILPLWFRASKPETSYSTWARRQPGRPYVQPWCLPTFQEKYLKQ